MRNGRDSRQQCVLMSRENASGPLRRIHRKISHAVRAAVENVAVTVCRYRVGPANNGAGGENITRDDEESALDALRDISRGNSGILPFSRGSLRGIANLHVESC